MRIPLDKQDKLHGCLEHLFNQVCKATPLHLKITIAFSLSMSIQDMGSTRLFKEIAFWGKANCQDFGVRCKQVYCRKVWGIDFVNIQVALCDLSKVDLPYLRHLTEGKKAFMKKGKYGQNSNTLYDLNGSHLQISGKSSQVQPTDVL